MPLSKISLLFVSISYATLKYYSFLEWYIPIVEGIVAIILPITRFTKYYHFAKCGNTLEANNVANYQLIQLLTKILLFCMVRKCTGRKNQRYYSAIICIPSSIVNNKFTVRLRPFLPQVLLTISSRRSVLAIPISCKISLFSIRRHSPERVMSYRFTSESADVRVLVSRSIFRILRVIFLYDLLQVLCVSARRSSLQATTVSPSRTQPRASPSFRLPRVFLIDRCFPLGLLPSQI